MAFPQTAAPTTSAFAAAATSHLVAMPATVNAGDLLFVHIAVNHIATPNPTITTPAGWTQKWATAISSIDRYGGYVKVADGTEGGTTVDFVTSSTTVAAAHCHRITDWYGALAGVEVGTAATGSSANPNPPSLTPSWGALDTLWFAVSGADDDDQAFTAAPTNYTNLASTIAGGGANASCEVGSAWRELNATNDNPGTFTLASTETWVAQTLAIRPAAAAAQGSRLALMGCG